jgi:hypothetical protein
MLSTKGPITSQVACVKGLVACYTPIAPSKHVQNMSRNAKMKNKGAKGRLGEKELQEYSCTDSINKYVHM